MWEFEIINKTTNERDIIFGYTFSDACRRAKISEKEWDCILETYVD